MLIPLVRGVFYAGLCGVAVACAAAPKDFAAAPSTTAPSRTPPAPSKIVLAEAMKSATITQTSQPDLTPVSGPPPQATLSHEGKAAALWTGRVYFGRNKILDARARDEPLAVLAAGGADGWRLENDGTNGAVFIHIESGLKCPAAIDLQVKQDDGASKERIYQLKDVTAFDARGRDVGCNYAVGGDALITLYTSFYPDLSLENHVAAAVAAIRQNFAVKGMLPVSLATLKPKEGLPPGEALDPAIAAAFDIGVINGVPYKTALWLGKTHGWHVKARATYAQADMGSELLAAILFAANYTNVHNKNIANPTMSGPEV